MIPNTGTNFHIIVGLLSFPALQEYFMKKVNYLKLVMNMSTLPSLHHHVDIRDAIFV